MLDTAKSPATLGLAILRGVTNRKWLSQPEQDMSIFREYLYVDRNWYSGRPALHSYDKNAMYLGAAGGVKLGVGPYTHRIAPTFDDAPGLWRIRITYTPPDFCGDNFPPIAQDMIGWEYTPTVRLLLDTGFGVAPLEAYTFAQAHQVLRAFYEHLREMRKFYQSNPVQLSYVKRIYAVTFGILAHEEPALAHKQNYLYRPDWWSMLVSHARAVILRQIIAVARTENVYPSALETDKVYYPAPVTGLPIGKEIGQFKYERL